MRHILKYWSLILPVELLHRLLELILLEGIVGTFQLCLLVLLLVRDFKYSEVIYDATIGKVLEANKEILHATITKVLSLST